MAEFDTHIGSHALTWANVLKPASLRVALRHFDVVWDELGRCELYSQVCYIERCE